MSPSKPVITPLEFRRGAVDRLMRTGDPSFRCRTTSRSVKASSFMTRSRNARCSSTLEGGTVGNQATFGRVVGVAAGDVIVGEPNNATKAGLVYVYRKVAGKWTEAAALSARDAQTNDGFGNSMDARGNLYVTANTAEGVWVYAPDGTLLGFIGVPEAPANCAWGGPGNSTLFITANTGVYRLPMKVAGQPLPIDAA